MSDQQLIALLEKYLQGRSTEEERNALETWYEAHRSVNIPGSTDPRPDLQQMYHDITGKLKTEGEWVEPQPAKVHPLKQGKWRMAAAVLLLMAAAGVWMLLPRANRQLALDTKEGVRKKIQLDDGTRVWLNVSSHLTYPANIGNGNRDIYLKGEAFFDVAPKEAHPFTIHTQGINVQVLGTRFNVKAYQADGSMETTLVEGRVAVSLNGQADKKLVLAPGEKLTVTKKEPMAARPAANVRVIDWGTVLAIVETITPATPGRKASELVWMDDRLEFKDKSFPELAILMSRWYNRKIILTDTFPADYRFKGTFKKESVTEVLKALQVTADFNFTIKGDSIFIHH